MQLWRAYLIKACLQQLDSLYNADATRACCWRQLRQRAATARNANLCTHAKSSAQTVRLLG